mgnify:CR=1 FL=1
MTSRVGINQLANHLLIGRVILLRGLLEEGNTRFAERHGYLHALLLEGQFFRRGQEIPDHTQIAKRFIRVFDFLFHKEPFPFASILPQRYESDVLCT